MSDRPSAPSTPATAGRSAGLLDTSVVIDIDLIDVALLPDETAISAVTLAELAAGPHAAVDDIERSRRQDRLLWAGSHWDPLPLDADVARAYGRVYAALTAGRRAGRRRFADLLIAATALAHAMPLYTRNPADLVGVERLIAIRAV